MIKKTLYFGNPAYLSVKDEQLKVEMKDTGEERTIPIEDIGVVLLDHYGVVISQYAISALLENNVAVIVCDKTHHPAGLLLTLSSHSIQEELFSHQIAASLPLKKQLWQQTVQCKIKNQAMVLHQFGKNNEPLLYLAKEVTSGDSTNIEARAARYYWDELFGKEFLRERFGMPPNNALNYGYAILRAVVARSLVGSGLLPTLGIHHHNRYNAFCLADDIMEPYRPYVDVLVKKLTERETIPEALTTALKKELLAIPAMDIVINGEQSPLMIGMQQTTSSLAQCFTGEEKKIVYPEMVSSFIR
ncbi:MAG: type II CRISPR-associated endonuclease Cas1 [Bacteroidota bacterium]